VHAKEKPKQNLVEKAFATHPLTEDRIRRGQKEISSFLPDKAEYILDTSAFQEVKARVPNLMRARSALHRRSLEEERRQQPALRPHN